MYYILNILNIDNVLYLATQKTSERARDFSRTSYRCIPAYQLIWKSFVYCVTNYEKVVMRRGATYL